MNNQLSNQQQKKQFIEALRRIEDQIGRSLSQDERHSLHKALHDKGREDYRSIEWIVEVGLIMFASKPKSRARPGSQKGLSRRDWRRVSRSTW